MDGQRADVRRCQRHQRVDDGHDPAAVEGELGADHVERRRPRARRERAQRAQAQAPATGPTIARSDDQRDVERARRALQRAARAARSRSRSPGSRGPPSARRPIEVGWTSWSDGADAPTTTILSRSSSGSTLPLDDLGERDGRDRAAAVRGSRSRLLAVELAAVDLLAGRLPRPSPTAKLLEPWTGSRPAEDAAGVGSRARVAGARADLRSTSSPPKTLVRAALVDLGRRQHDVVRARRRRRISALSSRGVGRLGELDVVGDRSRAGLAQPVDQLAVQRAREGPALLEPPEGLVVDLDHDDVVGRASVPADREPCVDRVELGAANRLGGVGGEADRGGDYRRSRRTRCCVSAPGSTLYRFRGSVA